MNLRDIPEIDELMNEIEDVQEGQDLRCSIKDCYWNMWNPKSKRYNNEESMQCTSESLADFKMTPNSTSCKGFYSYKLACGKFKWE